jgi:large subunit ribosomal protein L12e|tara:strand:+ start:128 stop:589 length:462 start_codon:yes stop_codon:yes gene_type:complete
MPPKAAIDPNEKKYIYMKVVGGEIAPAAALAPRCAPCGLAPKKVGEDIQKATKDWRGIKIYIEIMVQNRQATVSICPTAAPLILKALKEPPRDRKKTKNVVHNGKLSLDNIIAIAKEMRPKSMAASFKGTVLEVLGTCVSVGCTIDGKSPKDV